jgi:hypothetical protein
VFRAFEGVDLILHAGDLNALKVVSELETLAPVITVHGNNEDWETRDQLATTQLLEVEGARIGMAHGDVDKKGGISPLPGIYASGIAAATRFHTSQTSRLTAWSLATRTGPSSSGGRATMASRFCSSTPARRARSAVPHTTRADCCAWTALASKPNCSPGIEFSRET